MEYMGDKKYWDKKFRDRGETLLSPEKSLIENLGCFKEGSVLDLACGDGRNTLFLLEKSFEVTAVDFSEQALERLRAFAERKSLAVHTKHIDLSETGSLEKLGVFDNIIINHYRLTKTQLNGLGKHLRRDGILFVSGFGDKHRVDEKIRADDLIQPTDFDGIQEAMELITFDESQDERGVFVTYIFRKK